MLYAYPYSSDEGKYAGDSSYYPTLLNSVPHEGENFDDLKTKWLTQSPEGRDLAPDIEDNTIPTPTGFWVFTKQDLQTALAVWPDHCGNDSQVYTCNNSAKRVLAQMASTIEADPA